MRIGLTYFLSTAWLFFGLMAATGLLPAQAPGADADLAYYNDVFNALQEDIWDRAQYTHNPDQMKNFKLGDLEIAGNRLVMSTRPGAFSKAGLNSRYVFRGDFDVQIDCRLEFQKSLREMDQVVTFGFSNRPADNDIWRLALIRLEKKANRRSPRVIFLDVKNQRAASYQHQDTDDFNGSLRFIRKGRKMTGLIKKEGSGRWQTLGYSSHFTAEDVFAGFSLQNFDNKRRTINATETIKVVFDNYRINHADEIIEDEI